MPLLLARERWSISLPCSISCFERLADVPNRRHGGIVARFHHRGRCFKCPLLHVHLLLQLQVLCGIAHQSGLINAPRAADGAADQPAQAWSEHVADPTHYRAQHLSKSTWLLARRGGL